MNTISKELKKEIKKYQDLYYQTKAEYETIKEISNNNKLKVLADNIFYNEDGERELKLDYLIKEEQFPAFNQLHFYENLKSGLTVTEPNIVPEYDSWKRLLDIEKELFKLQLETVPNELKRI